MLLLDHVGRKSGKWRTVPLVYLRDGDDMVIVASKGGSRTHPSWYLNLRDMEETTVQRGSKTIPVSVNVANPKERERLWPRVVDLYGGYAGYQRRTNREIPLVVLKPLKTAAQSDK